MNLSISGCLESTIKSLLRGQQQLHPQLVILASVRPTTAQIFFLSLSLEPREEKNSPVRFHRLVLPLQQPLRSLVLAEIRLDWMYWGSCCSSVAAAKEGCRAFPTGWIFFPPFSTSESHHECCTCFASADGAKRCGHRSLVVIFHCDEGEDSAAVTRPTAPQRSSGDGSCQVFRTGWRVRGC